MPGQTLLTRMDGANSAASARVRLTTPPFEAAYAVIFGVLGKRPCPDAMFTMVAKDALASQGRQQRMVTVAEIQKDLPGWPDDVVEQWLHYFANEPDFGWPPPVPFMDHRWGLLLGGCLRHRAYKITK